MKFNLPCDGCIIMPSCKHKIRKKFIDLLIIDVECIILDKYISEVKHRYMDQVKTHLIECIFKINHDNNKILYMYSSKFHSLRRNI